MQHNWLIKAPIEGQRLRYRYSPGPALAALRAGKIAPNPPAPAPEAKDAPTPKTGAPAPASAAAAPAVATPPAPAQRQGRHKPYGLLPPLDVNSLTVQTGPLPQPARVPGGRYADLFKKLSAPDTFTLAPIAYLHSIKSAARLYSRRAPGTKFTVMREPGGLLCRIHREA